MIEADRRLFLAGLGTALVAGLHGPLLASSVAGYQMWHSPGCGCCLEWKKRVEAQFKRKMPVFERQDLAAIKRANGVPDDLRSCHTALIGTVVVEGHVPPADIRRFIDKRPKGFAGLAVAGMPVGAPGMDVGHNRKQPFKVYAFDNKGRRAVFASYGA